MSPPTEDPLDAYARALDVFGRWLAERGVEGAQSREEFLTEHADLREILVGMLDADITATSPGSASKGQTPPTAPVTRLEEGGDFGVYHILESIGQGGMGAVYLAEHRELGRRVALKVIRPERMWSSVALERFWREARAVARLDHPHICPVYDVGEIDGIPFMAMRYLEGSSFEDLLAAARATTDVDEHAVTHVSVPPATEGAVDRSTDAAPATRKEIHRILELFEKIARALHTAHESGIVHRDIKPGNLFVTADGEPVVLDFGLARSEEEEEQNLTMSGDVLGTPLYMSAEQIEPRGRRLDRTTDVYSLGVTLYECLTLNRPFEGQSLRELQNAILDGSPVPATKVNRQIPRDLEIVIGKAMERARARRYRTAQEFAEELRRVRCLEPILARPAGWFLRTRRWVQRYPLAASLIAVIACALIAVLFLLAVVQEGKDEYDLLAWGQRLKDAKTAERAIYPAHPNRITKFEDWLSNHGRPLVQHIPEFRATLAEVQARATPEFANNEDRFKFGMLTQLIEDTERFEKEELARAEALLGWIGEVEEQSLESHADTWKQARLAIKSHPLYQGLNLTQQIGLVPIGADRQSSLWEFAHLRSGAIPQRDAETGKLVISNQSCVVFVLLPGGTFAMGAQNEEPDGANYDPLARGMEGPVHEVPLGPFLIAKYELTVDQWKRLKAASTDLPDRRRRAHPAQGVSCSEATLVLGWYGLDLPTEAQWEYACRAGTYTPWYTGRERDSLSGHVNFADKAAAAKDKGWSEIQDWKGLNDGYDMSAPVDALSPNPFGLHHMHGNVWELCRDGLVKYEDDKPPRPGDGLRDDKWKYKVHRGASYDTSFIQARSAYRGGAGVNVRGPSFGLRPVRRLEE